MNCLLNQTPLDFYTTILINLSNAFKVKGKLYLKYGDCISNLGLGINLNYTIFTNVSRPFPNLEYNINELNTYDADTISNIYTYLDNFTITNCSSVIIPGQQYCTDFVMDNLFFLLEYPSIQNNYVGITNYINIPQSITLSGLINIYDYISFKYDNEINSSNNAIYVPCNFPINKWWMMMQPLTSLDIGYNNTIILVYVSQTGKIIFYNINELNSIDKSYVIYGRPTDFPIFIPFESDLTLYTLNNAAIDISVNNCMEPYVHIDKNVENGTYTVDDNNLNLYLNKSIQSFKIYGLNKSLFTILTDISIKPYQTYKLNYNYIHFLNNTNINIATSLKWFLTIDYLCNYIYMSINNCILLYNPNNYELKYKKFHSFSSIDFD